MIHVSLFSGIGGFDLAAEAAGFKNVAHCEIAKHNRIILNHYWPQSYSHGDIKTLSGETIKVEIKNRFGIDFDSELSLLTGGFPCQPFSNTGFKKGTNDERYLWPEMFRVTRELKPDWIIAENVQGLLSWSDGQVLKVVQDDLEREGYEVQHFLLPANFTGAPHRRNRIWIVGNKKARTQKAIADTNGTRSEICNIPEVASEKEYIADKNNNGRRINRYVKPSTEPPVLIRDYGVSERLGKRAFAGSHQKVIKSLGNAIVPQVALAIIESIIDYETSKGKSIL